MKQWKDSDRNSNLPEVYNADSVARLILIFVVVPILLVATYFIGQIPYAVTSYRQLDNYAAGKRVRFICQYKGKVGTFRHLDFEGRPLLLKIRPDKNERTPEVGGTYSVVGELKHLGRQIEGIDGIVDYVITNGEFHPANRR